MNVYTTLLLQAHNTTRSHSRKRGQCMSVTAASAASAPDAGGAVSVGGEAAGSPSVAARMIAFQQAFWKFLRPHTIRGTILGSIAVTARALIECPAVRS